MNICMLAGNPLTFDGRVLRHTKSLLRDGHHVTLLGVIGPNDQACELSPLPNLRVLRLDRRKVGVLPRLTWLLSAARRHAAGYLVENLRELAPRLADELLVAPCALELLAMALATNADIYHANDLDTLVPAAWAAKLCNRPYIYDAHELYADESPHLRPGERAARARVEQHLITGALATLTVSDLLADELLRRYKVPRPVVLRNLPETVPLTPKVRAAEDRPLRLLLHGAWVGLEQPGVETLLLALTAIPNAILTLRGGVRDEPALARRVQALGLFGRVVRKPRLPGAEALVASAIAEQHDIGLSVHLPDCDSRRLATSSKVFEYLMAGLAVVGTDLPGNRHILEDLARQSPTPPGLLYAPGDAQDLAAKLADLAADKPRLTAMKLAARALAERSLCWEHEAPRLLQLYK